MQKNNRKSQLTIAHAALVHALHAVPRTLKSEWDKFIVGSIKTMHDRLGLEADKPVAQHRLRLDQADANALLILLKYEKEWIAGGGVPVPPVIEATIHYLKSYVETGDLPKAIKTKPSEVIEAGVAVETQQTQTPAQILQ